MGRSGMNAGGGGAGRSAGGSNGNGRSGGAGRSAGGGAAGGRPAGAGRAAGARPAAGRPAGGAGARPAAGRPAGGAGTRPAAGRPAGAHPAPHGPARKRRRPFVRPMPFGLVSRYATDYIVCTAVLAALERLYQGYGTVEDEIRCRDFFGRTLLASEYYDCYIWMQEYMRECW